jgi:hypothetical protein
MSASVTYIGSAFGDQLQGMWRSYTMDLRKIDPENVVQLGAYVKVHGIATMALPSLGQRLFRWLFLLLQLFHFQLNRFVTLNQLAGIEINQRQ